jgi:hypothetical protein
VLIGQGLEADGLARCIRRSGNGRGVASTAAPIAAAHSLWLQRPLPYGPARFTSLVNSAAQKGAAPEQVADGAGADLGLLGLGMGAMILGLAFRSVALRRASPTITLQEIGRQLQAMTIPSARGHLTLSDSIVAQLLKPTGLGAVKP